MAGSGIVHGTVEFKMSYVTLAKQGAIFLNFKQREVARCDCVLLDTSIVRLNLGQYTELKLVASNITETLLDARLVPLNSRKTKGRIASSSYQSTLNPTHKSQSLCKHSHSNTLTETRAPSSQ